MLQPLATKNSSLEMRVDTCAPSIRQVGIAGSSSDRALETLTCPRTVDDWRYRLTQASYRYFTWMPDNSIPIRLATEIISKSADGSSGRASLRR